MKKVSNFIEKHNIFAFVLTLLQLPLNFLMVFSCFYNVPSIISAAMCIICDIHLLGWHFGKTPYIKDFLWNNLKRQNRTDMYRDECLKISTLAFIVGNICFIIGVALYFVFLFI